jgi:hypothetical protein
MSCHDGKQEACLVEQIGIKWLEFNKYDTIEMKAGGDQYTPENGYPSKSLGRPVVLRKV